MFATAQRWFTPPAFEDGEQGRIASLLHLMSLTLLAVSAITAISAVILGHARAALILAIGTAGPIGALWLTRRGRLKAASLLILFVFLGVLTFLLFNADGFHDVAVLAYPVVIVMAALLLDKRAFTLYILLTTSALLGIIYGELNGYIVNRLSAFTSPADLIYVSVIMLITATSARQFSNNIAQSIAKVRASQRALAESNLELQRQVAERKRMEEAYRALVDHSLQGLLIFQGDRIVFANQAFATMSGYSVEELLAMSPKEISAIVPPEDQALVWGHFEDSLYQRDVLDRYECRGLRKDGTVSWVETYASLTEYQGKPAIQMAILDITERRRAENELHEKEAHEALVLRSLPMAFYIAQPFGDFGGMWVSEQIHRVSGFTAQQFLADTHLWASRLHPGDRTRALEAFGELLDKDTIEVEYRWQAADGQYLWFLDQAVLIRDKNGKPKEIVGTWLDITERKRAEGEREHLLAQIREQARRVQQIVDTVPEGVLLLNVDGQIILANPVAEEELATLAGVNVGDTVRHLGDRPLTELLTSPPKGLWHEVTADGRSFQVIARPIETGPEPDGWVVVIRNVSQQREIERRIQEQERLAAVGQLAAGIAHDFNNIMATIVLYAQMTTRSEGLSALDRERLATINQQAQHATVLIQQILDFSRRAALERRPMDLLVFLKEQIRLLERILPENIEIDLVCDRGDYPIRADPTRIQQAIINLAVNARDAMPDGGKLRVGLGRVRFEESGQVPLPETMAGEWIRLRLSDTGTGIPPDVLPHVFEPFFTTKPVGEGTGLGLAQVWGIVKQHEGHVDVTTTPGEGTTFTLYLPALETLRQDTPKQGRSHLAQGQGQTILVAEDSTSLRETLAQALRMLNYRVLMATNGRRALSTFEQHAEQISLVLTDMVMPGMGGVALSHALREKDWAGPIIIVTGHPLHKKEHEPQLQGAVTWLQKPVNLEQLAEVVAQVLGS